MLRELHIENIAVIERADIEPGPGLNVLTGETGAGKSIVIDSLQAVLGGRVSRELVRTGAPKAEVTVPMESSVGANTVRANRSQKTQNTAPQRKDAGITKAGFADFSRLRVMWGTAIPTKEIGPARAVTQAESRLESRISATRKGLIRTPMLWA